MPSALIMLSSITVESERIYGGKDIWRRYIRKFQLADPDYNKQLAINVIIGVDIYSFLMRDGFRCLKEPVISHHALLAIDGY